MKMTPFARLTMEFDRRGGYLLTIFSWSIPREVHKAHSQGVAPVRERQHSHLVLHLTFVPPFGKFPRAVLPMLFIARLPRS